MEFIGVALFIAMFLAVPAIALVVAVEFFRVGRDVRRDHPELYDRFGGYGRYPGSRNHNLMLFVLGKSLDCEVDDERLMRRCRRVRDLALTGVCILCAGSFLAMTFGS